MGNPWLWLPAALAVLDGAVLASHMRRKDPPAWLKAGDVFASLATLLGLLAWIRWGGGLEQPAAMWAWSTLYVAWGVAITLVADWRNGRPLGSSRFWLWIGDTICLAAISAHFLAGRFWALAPVWLGLAAAHIALAFLFHRRTPDDRRGAALFFALATVLCALLPVVAGRELSALAEAPSFGAMAWWALLGPLLIAAGRWRRIPAMRLAGFFMCVLLLARSLYDCRPEKQDAHLNDVSPETHVPHIRDETNEIIGISMENVVSWVRPWWLLAGAPVCFLMAGAAQAIRRPRGALSANGHPLAAAQGTRSPSLPPSTPSAPPASAAAGREAAIGGVLMGRLDDWLAPCAWRAAAVAGLFFGHLEWTAWLLWWSSSEAETYYFVGTGTAVLWGLAAVPFFRLPNAVDRSIGAVCWCIAAIAAGSVLARSPYTAASAMPWPLWLIRAGAYATVLSVAAWRVRRWRVKDYRLLATGVILALSGWCLVETIVAGFR